MSLTDRQRIEQQTRSARIVLLWKALQPLKSTVSFMSTGAHPDDETSSMLAALGFRDGLLLSYACANRGEGGQNDIGTETTENLGVIRTAEMERAADALRLRLYWLSESPDDSIFDFGFSKSGRETLGRWGRERTLKRMVDILRQERPDIVCPTFLDIPGQHGHHRAMTETVIAAFHTAADASYTHSLLPPWSVKKLYLPAWSGAGDAYDDDQPPPTATLSILAKGEDSLTGWSFAQMAQQSRVCHLTQGMGRWVAYGNDQDWPLHLLESRVPGPDNDICSGLPASLAMLAQFADAPAIAQSLAAAQSAIDQALAQFPDNPAVLAAASNALSHIRKAVAECPDNASPEVLHRLAHKERQLAIVIRLAAGVWARGWLSHDYVRPNDTVELSTELQSSSAAQVSLQAVLPDNWLRHNNHLQIQPGCRPDDPYPAVYLPEEPQPPALQINIDCHGISTATTIPFETRPMVLPPDTVDVFPKTLLLNTAITNRRFDVEINGCFPADNAVSLQCPPGWQVVQSGNQLQLNAPDNVTEGLITLPILLNGSATSSVRKMMYPHIAPRIRTFPADITVRILDAVIPSARVAYVGGGNDRVAFWMCAMGIQVTELTDSQLENPATMNDYDSLVVGLFAMRTRPALAACMHRIHQWVENGGNLLTLYHRPWDGWHSDTTPPRPLEIGKPSLRWRVTDENATVTHLLPDHPLLNAPNTITPSDWEGWHKERGLYFAMRWDSAYQALLSMADPGEEAHHGALLSASIGHGRHTHTSLILHHQMEQLTPGAFRLMANLVAGVNS